MVLQPATSRSLIMAAELTAKHVSWPATNQPPFPCSNLLPLTCVDPHVSLHLRGFLEHLVAHGAPVARRRLATAFATQSGAARSVGCLVDGQVLIQLARQLEALEAQLGRKRYRV